MVPQASQRSISGLMWCGTQTLVQPSAASAGPKNSAGANRLAVGRGLADLGDLLVV